MKKLFIVLAVMAIVIGCTEQHPPQFGQVWKKINKPEEARVILAKVNTHYLTESGKADGFSQTTSFCACPATVTRASRMVMMAFLFIIY